ncbi:MAG: type I methionyl aminopeptidase [Candidatus Omnitrophota bacterium]
MIEIRSGREIALMRKAGVIVARVFEKLQGAIEPGITTKELDDLAIKVIKSLNGEAAFLGYKGYPASICTSVNDVVVHGIPAATKVKSGSILSVDIGVKYRGYFADAAATFPVGRISGEAMRLIEAAETALEAGIEQARPGNRVSDISHAVQDLAESKGFSVVRAFVGHGIGSNLHEEPEIPNYGEPGKGARLDPGMALAIEPMINEGTWEVKVLDDGWTAVTKDGKLSAHFEHTVLVTEGSAEVLTKWQRKSR